MKKSDLQFRFARDVIALLTFCDEETNNGCLDKFVIGMVWRPVEYQKILKDGVTCPYCSNLHPDYPGGCSQTLKSRHIEKMAIDLYFWINGAFVENKRANKSLLVHIGEYWESLYPKNRWGGNYRSFTDLPHFECLS